MTVFAIYERSTWFELRRLESEKKRSISKAVDIRILEPLRVILPTSPFFLRARIASAVGRKTISRQFFWSLRRYPLHGWQRSATCPVEATVRGWPEMVGREEGGPPVRRPLRSGRAIKVFAHEEVEAEEPGERRACKKEKSRGRRKGKIMDVSRFHDRQM